MEGVLTGFVTIGIVIAVGAFIAHIRLVDISAQVLLSKVAFYVASPALLLTTIANTDVGEVISGNLVATGVAIAIPAGLYAVLAFSAFRVTQRAGQSGEESTQSFTAAVLDNPGGRILVGIIGIGIIGGGLFYIYRGWTKGFDKYLESHPGRFVMESGRVGYIAKGIAFCVIGALFVTAAFSERAEDAGGMDGALQAVQQQPFGPYLLTVVAVGIAAFGVYCFGRARHAKL